MADETKIQWTEATVNPVMGCTRADESCRNCYALAMMRQKRGQKGWPVHENTVTLFPERLEKLARMRKPKMIFMPSMGDLFHKDVPLGFVQKCFLAMKNTPQHTYQVLTKRVGRMAQAYKLFCQTYDGGVSANALGNVWLGVSIGAGQHIADRDIPILLSIPAAARFVSVEPMLQEINLKTWLGVYCKQWVKLDWVIAGCESGPKRRHISTDAFRHLRDQCVEAGVPFFLKQMEANGKVVKMPELDGRVWDEMPNVNFFQPVQVQTSF